MKACLSICLVLAAVLFGAGSTTVDGSTIYTGSLSTVDGGLTGTGDWVTLSGLTGTGGGWGDSPVTLSWTVSQNESDWHYHYNLVVPSHDISHIIVEASPNFTIDDVLDAVGAFETLSVGDFSDANGNPSMPGSVHGIKFDETSTTNLTIDFDSRRVPVWGDFYAKDGVSPNTQTFNVIWNTGFTAADPVVPAHNGSEAFHLLVPDTIIPEPSTIMMLLTGLIAGGLYLLRRK
ncbi:MAG: PEP-CTERM sorting domain-containing protein [Candidatus Staskawiczbacteria bacterium]|nr:PEP-CTERM sorting domain-containing protein [Candidatus Staskawiczbacteria bacterium]